MKSKDTIEKHIYCKACMKEMKVSPIRNLLERDPLLCDECISEIIKKLEIRRIFDIPILFLSEYDGYLKSLLMNYKEYGDIELAGCFLYIFQPFIRLMFPNSVFLPLPSSKKRIRKRGFAHLEEMLKASHLNYLSVFERDDDIEQKTQKGSHRFQDKGIYLGKEAEKLKGRHVVLFDDVMTSGSTFRECLKLVSNAKVRKINGLILMDHYNKGKITH